MRSFTTSSGVVMNPAKAEAVAELMMLSVRVGFSRSLVTKSFIFSKEAKKMALKGPKKRRVAP